MSHGLFSTWSCHAGFKALVSVQVDRKDRGDHTHIRSMYDLSIDRSFPRHCVPCSCWQAVTSFCLGSQKIHKTRIDGQAANFVSMLKLSLGQPVYLVLAIVSTLTCFSAFIICLLTKHLPKKWLWAAFTLIGVTPVSANFATGSLAIAPLSIIFGGSGISPYAAIIGLTITPFMPSLPEGIIFSLPLGAIVFLFNRNSRLIADRDLPPANYS